MKKVIVLFSFLLATCTAPVGICAGTDTRTQVGVDSRIELISVIQLLSNYRENVPGAFTRFDLKYKVELLAYFGPFRNHEAVRLFDDLWPKGLNYDAPPTLILHHSDPPALKQIHPYSSYILGRSGGEKKIEEFTAALREFVEESRFMNFYNDHRTEYSRIESDTRGKIGNIDFGATLEQYFGETKGSYNIVLAPTFHAGGYGPKVTDSDGNGHLYSVIGPRSENDGWPDFGSAERFRDLGWHEFGHSFVNPLTENNQKRIDATSLLFEPIREAMAEHSYTSWKTCVNEHILRAIHIYLLQDYVADSDTETYLYEQRAEHFAYIEKIAERLMEYATNRERYPDFAGFFPRLLDLFDELASVELDAQFFRAPFAGRLGTVWNDQDLLVILPTAESNEEAGQKIAEDIAAILEMLQKRARVVPDTLALGQDLSRSHIVVYGTPAGNLWLKQHFGFLSEIVKPDRIVTNTTFEGSDLRFCAAYPNPFNPSRGVSIYTAQTPEAVVQINQLISGGTDFVVGKGTEVLQRGNFRKSASGWRF